MFENGVFNSIWFKSVWPLRVQDSTLISGEISDQSQTHSAVITKATTSQMNTFGFLLVVSRPPKLARKPPFPKSSNPICLHPNKSTCHKSTNDPLISAHDSVSKLINPVKGPVVEQCLPRMVLPQNPVKVRWQGQVKYLPQNDWLVLAQSGIYSLQLGADFLSRGKSQIWWHSGASISANITASNSMSFINFTAIS